MAGGVERMASVIMNEMVIRGFRIGLVTWDCHDAIPHYFLDSSVEWIKIDQGSPEVRASWTLRFKRQLAIRKITRNFKPNLAIGFQLGTFLAARLATIGLGVPFIAAERNAPDLFDFVANGGRLRRRAQLGLRLADCITIQLKSYLDKYPVKLRDRIFTIPNSVSVIKDPAYPNEKPMPPRRILHVGRLSFQKNQEFLIHAFALINLRYPDWILTLVGEGENRFILEKLIIKNGLTDCVEMVGSVKDVDKWYRDSAFLAFPSLWEGFPNALVEAFSQGLPAIGFEKTAGVNELIINNENGLLVPNNVVDFSLGMESMINNIEFRQIAGRSARASVLAYTPDLIFSQWAELFIHTAKKYSNRHFILPF